MFINVYTVQINIPQGACNEESAPTGIKPASLGWMSMNESCWPTLTSCLLSLNGFPLPVLLQHFVWERQKKSLVSEWAQIGNKLENPAQHLEHSNYSQIVLDKRTKSPTHLLWKSRLKFPLTSKKEVSIFKHSFQTSCPTRKIMLKQPNPAIG